VARHFCQSGGNKQILVAEVPKGQLAIGNFIENDAQVPELKDGEVLVQTLAITIGAGQRAGLQGSATYAGASGAENNVVMNGTGVGRVVKSHDSRHTEGDLVMCSTGWQEFAAFPGKALTSVVAGVDPATMLGALGTNGLTAFFGLLDIGEPKPGETVVVSGAAGSVGHIVGQIAKIKGARVVGVAGSDEKCAYLTNDLGFDAAVNYKSDSFREDLKAATPQRIDVYFDNTGGDILQSALFRMNKFGRIVCCGNISQYDKAKGGASPRGIPGMLVNNQVRMQGFVVYSFAQRFDEARAQMMKWVESGQLTARTTQYQGLTTAPQAFVDLLAGKTVGTTVINV
jgi:NADPH-dependent curcumin reductase CurA